MSILFGVSLLVLYGVIAFFVVRGYGTTERVSLSDGEVEGDAMSGHNYYDFSSDGRYVVFTSNATNLVSGDTNGKTDVFLRDRQLGTTVRVSVATGGTQANDDSYGPSVSDDGRYVSFNSAATNLVGGDSNGAIDVFRHDVQTVTTVRVSVATGGTQANSGSNGTYQSAISSNGRYVSFQSQATNLVVGDSNAVADIFRHDVDTTTTIRVSVATGGTQADGVSYPPSMSGDGNYFAWYSDATNLVGDDSNLTYDVFHRDVLSDITTRVSVQSDGGQVIAGALYPSISDNGRYVTFVSSSVDLVDNDTNNKADIFLHDTQTSETTRVSIATSGTEGNDDALYSFVSDSGALIVFSSPATNLVTGDTNGSADIFLRNTATGITQRISLSSSGVQGDAYSSLPVITPSGTYVLFGSSATNLVSGDTNGVYDLFLNTIELETATSSGMTFVIPPTCTITSTPQTITPNQPTTLSWSASPTSAPYYYRLNNGEVIPSTTTSQIVSPLETTTYTLSTINLFGANFCETTVTVENPIEDEQTIPVIPDEQIIPPTGLEPLSCTLSATPSTLTQNQSTQLTWDISGGEAPYLTWYNPNQDPIQAPYTIQPLHSGPVHIYIKDDENNISACTTQVIVASLVPPVVPPQTIPPQPAPTIIPLQQGDLASAGQAPDINLPVQDWQASSDEPTPLRQSSAWQAIYLSLADFFRSNSLITQIITTTLLLLGVITALGSSLFASPLSLSELIFIPMRLWSILLTAFGYKKQSRPWGIIYDSVTKAPLDPVYVSLLDLEGKEIASSITDMDGRYGFLVPPGKYRITAGKGDYSFPSQILIGTSNDALYHDLYFGDVITIYFEGDVIQKNIPLDPTGINWNEQTKQVNNLTHFFKRHDYHIAQISNILFIIGAILATLALFFAPQPYNLMIFALYVVFLIIKILKLKPRQYSTITKSDGTPLNGIIHFNSLTQGKEVVKKPILNGKFYALVPNGNYSAVIEERVGTNEYVKRGEVGMIVTEGFVSESITV